MLGQRLLNAVVFVAIVSPILGLTLDDEWGIWKEEHGKRYEDEQSELKRREIWEQNRSRINLNNFEYIMGLRSYTLGLNSYSDMHPDEFVSSRKRTYLKELERMLLDSKIVDGDLADKRSYQQVYQPELDKRTVPDSVDWRTEGYVNAVGNQKQCGSSWAFSATGSMAGQLFRKTGILPRLSPQQLMDCSSSYGNHGCQGGRLDNSFRFMTNAGVVLESSYPYYASNERCSMSARDIVGYAKGFVEIPSGDENALKTAVATEGPISALIDASLVMSFQLYHSGVYNSGECSTTLLDHGVLIVGYGTENGQDYWLVQNSWGTGWGEDGYIKMARNHGNQCGIATSASYPLV